MRNATHNSCQLLQRCGTSLVSFEARHTMDDFGLIMRYIFAT